MSKDMLNIDDFMRDRLGSHSEQEDPKAWLKMKALLDEEMPERAVPFYFRLRKPLAFIGAALLAGVLCVGGYRIHALRSGAGSPGGSSEPSIPVGNNPSDTHISRESSIAPVEPSIAENITETVAANKSNASGRVPGNSVNPVSAATDPKDYQNATHSSVTKSNNPAPIPVSPESQSNNAVSTSLAKELNNNPAPHLAKQKGIWSSTGLPKGSITAAATARTSESVTTLGAKTTELNSDRQSVQPMQPLRPGKNIARHAAQLQDNTSPHKAADPINSGTQANETGAKHVDSINTIITVNKPTHTDRNSRAVTYITDTVAAEKIALPQAPVAATETQKQEHQLIGDLPAPNPKDQKDAARASKRNNKDWARNAAKLQKNQFNSATPQGLPTSPTELATQTEANATVSGHRKNAIARFVDNLRVDEKAAEAKRAIGNAERYIGFSVGGNYSVSSAADFRGIQFGPTGELVFNKHWSFFAALRYFNRSGASRTVNDNYTEDVSSNVPDSIRGANHYFTIFTDSTSRHFNFSTVQSLEMPLSVRYSFKNFYLMTGLNLIYTLPVNVELYQKNEGTQRSHVIATNSTSKPIIENPGNIYDASSFKSRFGLGYIVGAGYRFAPAWHADFQLVNTFWDNSNNVGAKDVSKNFFRVPSVQFSIGFQFNRGTKKPTFGPTNTTR